MSGAGVCGINARSLCFNCLLEGTRIDGVWNFITLIAVMKDSWFLQLLLEQHQDGVNLIDRATASLNRHWELQTRASHRILLAIKVCLCQNFLIAAIRLMRLFFPMLVKGPHEPLRLRLCCLVYCESSALHRVGE
jgi:hypothetical protein